MVKCDICGKKLCNKKRCIYYKNSELASCFASSDCYSYQNKTLKLDSINVCSICFKREKDKTEVSQKLIDLSIVREL